LPAKNLKEYFPVSFEVVSNDHHRVLELVGRVWVEQDQVIQTLEDALEFGKEAFQVKL